MYAKRALFTGMSEKEWKKENSLKPEKIWLLLRRIMKKLEWTLLKAKEKKEKNTKKLIRSHKYVSLILEINNFWCKLEHLFWPKNNLHTEIIQHLGNQLFHCSKLVYLQKHNENTRFFLLKLETCITKS